MTEHSGPRTAFDFRPGLTVLLGAAFGAALHPVWQLEARWLVIVVVAVVGVAVALMFTARLFDFLFVSLLATLPFSAFLKWFAPAGLEGEAFGAAAYAGMAHIGLADFLLIGLFGAWALGFAPPRPPAMDRRHWIDTAVILLIIAHVVSIIGVPDPALGIGAVLFVMKFAAYYYIISRHFMPRHVPWLTTAVLWSILIVSAIGLFQTFTGLGVGLALDKGAGGEALQTQYQVPGIEYIARATGTSYDSHAYGGFVGMLLMLVLGSLLRPGQPRHVVVVLIGFSLLAISAVVVSYSRSAYLSLALGLGVVIAAAAWRGEWRAVRILLVPILAVLPLAPWLLSRVIERFVTAPWEIMVARFEQYEVAVDVWLAHPFFGFGAGNYMEALRIYNRDGFLELPVHNAMLWMLTESGVFGAACFFAILFGAMFGYWRLFAARDPSVSWLALGGLGALAVYFFDGLTHPLFREPTLFTFFWLLVGLLVAVQRHVAARKEMVT
ncbi:MAG: O-antigen ligase domain-containing protein [Rhodospirillales bacterium]|nr:MAG: O-antigen ligase domain-containing protein [Rhodospirillales bacterium]